MTVGVGLAGIVVHPGWAPLRLLFNPMQLEFAVGILVWVARRQRWTARWGGAALLAGPLPLAIGLLFGLGVTFSAHFDAAVSGSSGLARSWTWGMPWALVLAGIVDARDGGAVGRVLVRLGNASYAIYLVHPCLLTLLARSDGVLGAIRPLAYVVVFVALASAIGRIVHATLERPLLGLVTRRCRAPRLGGRRSPDDPYSLGQAAWPKLAG